MSFPGFKQLPADAIGKVRVAKVLTQEQYDEFIKTTKLKRVGECPLDGPPIIEQLSVEPTIDVSTLALHRTSSALHRSLIELANTSLESE